MIDLSDVLKPNEIVLNYHRFMATPICIQKEGDRLSFDSALIRRTIRTIKERYRYYTDDDNARIR